MDKKAKAQAKRARRNQRKLDGGPNHREQPPRSSEANTMLNS
jgi:hypothetical protein